MIIVFLFVHDLIKMVCELLQLENVFVKDFIWRSCWHEIKSNLVPWNIETFLLHFILQIFSLYYQLNNDIVQHFFSLVQISIVSGPCFFFSNFPQVKNLSLVKFCIKKKMHSFFCFLNSPPPPILGIIVSHLSRCSLIQRNVEVFFSDLNIFVKTDFNG